MLKIDDLQILLHNEAYMSAPRRAAIANCDHQTIHGFTSLSVHSGGLT
jgi:hypothetical protein